jgi:hypothetical protein
MPQRTFLSEAEARAIHADRRSHAIVARQYKVSTMTVSQIKTGKTWKHLGLTPSAKHLTLEQYEHTKTAKRHDHSSGGGDQAGDDIGDTSA